MKYLVVILVLIMAGCVTTQPQMCPPEDVMVGYRAEDGTARPLKIPAGLFDGGYTTVEEYEAVLQERIDTQIESQQP